MMKRIRPEHINWREAFWERAESSYCGNDLECRRCEGAGLVADADESPAVCEACAGSGLIVPRREPADVDDLAGLDLAWTAVSGDDLDWPQVPFAWLAGEAGLRHIGFARCERGVVGWVQNGRLLFGLTAWTPPAHARDLLLGAYMEAFDFPAEEVRFVIPRRCQT